MLINLNLVEFDDNSCLKWTKVTYSIFYYFMSQRHIRMHAFQKDQFA
jgi:hypothetical protein